MINVNVPSLANKLPRINWTHSTLIIGLHVFGLLSVWFWPRPIDLILFVVLYLGTTLSIGVGYHRLLTHRGFKCPTFLRRVLAWTGAAALQGGPARWTAIHRRHHQTADQHGDPHSPVKGFLHAHIGWVLHQDEEEGSDYRLLVPDVSGDDRWMRILDNGPFFMMPWFLTAIACFLIAGWRGVLWGAVMRTLVLWHLTWCINSVCHVWGSRPNETRDESRNVWWLGLLTLGEGWHNNHHARPVSAVHGWKWYEVDISGYVIRLLARAGIIWNVVLQRRAS